MGAGDSGEDIAGDGGVLFEVAAAEVIESGLGDAELLGGDDAMVDGAAKDADHGTGAGGGDFVQTIGAVDDITALETEAGEGHGHQFGGAGGGSADELGGGAGGVGEGSEEVEGGPVFEFGAGLGGVLHGGVVVGGEEEADADFADGLAGDFGGEVDAGAEGFEQVGGTAAGGVGAIAVLGDLDAGAGGDEGGEGGDVEGALGVAAGAAGVEDGFTGDAVVDLETGFAHGFGKAAEFVGGFTFEVESGGESGDLGGGGVAGEDSGHGEAGVPGGEGLPVHQTMQVGQEGHGILAVCGLFFKSLAQAD